jgi:hypothetical protein
MSPKDQKLMNSRLQAALKLQALCFDAANRTPGSFMNRDRAMDVVDALVTVVLDTVDQFLIDEQHNCVHAIDTHQQRVDKTAKHQHKEDKNAKACNSGI